MAEATVLTRILAGGLESQESNSLIDDSQDYASGTRIPAHRVIPEGMLKGIKSS